MELSMVRCNQIKIEITDENQPGPKKLPLNAFCKGCPSKDTGSKCFLNFSLTKGHSYSSTQIYLMNGV